MSDPNDNKPKVIKLGSRLPRSSNAAKWVEKIYSTLPKNPLDHSQVAMVFGQGPDQQIALFKILPSRSDPDAAYIEWFQAYPQKQGVGSKAMAKLQQMAREDGIKLVLTSWKHGSVPEKTLNRIYKNMGFTGKSREGLVWDPTSSVEEANSSYQPFDDYTDPKKRKKVDRSRPLKMEPFDIGNSPFPKTDPEDDGIREPPITKFINGIGIFVLTGHFRDRMRQRYVNPDDALGLIDKSFKQNLKQILDAPYEREILLKDKRSKLGIIMKKTYQPTANKYVFVTVHPNFNRYKDKYVIKEENTLLDKKTPSVEDLALKYDVSPHDVLRELSKGVKIEQEHTSLLHVAREIALDHLAEDLYYYVKLAKAEDGIVKGKKGN